MHVNNVTFLYQDISETELNVKFRDRQIVVEQRKNFSMGHRVEQLACVIETHLQIGEGGEGGEWRTYLASSKWPNKESPKRKTLEKNKNAYS